MSKYNYKSNDLVQIIKNSNIPNDALVLFSSDEEGNFFYGTFENAIQVDKKSVIMYPIVEYDMEEKKFDDSFEHKILKVEDLIKILEKQNVMVKLSADEGGNFITNKIIPEYNPVDNILFFFPLQ